MPDEINQQAPVQQLAPLSSLEVGAGEGSKSQAPNAALVLDDCSHPEGAASYQSTQEHTKRQGFQELYGRKQRTKTKRISQCHNPSFLQGWGDTGSNAAAGTARTRLDVGKTDRQPLLGDVRGVRSAFSFCSAPFPFLEGHRHSSCPRKPPRHRHFHDCCAHVI